MLRGNDKLHRLYPAKEANLKHPNPDRAIIQTDSLLGGDRL
jgi:hypothetical protein